MSRRTSALQAQGRVGWGVSHTAELEADGECTFPKYLTVRITLKKKLTIEGLLGYLGIV